MNAMRLLKSKSISLNLFLTTNKQTRQTRAAPAQHSTETAVQTRGVSIRSRRKLAQVTAGAAGVGLCHASLPHVLDGERLSELFEEAVRLELVEVIAGLLTLVNVNRKLNPMPELNNTQHRKQNESRNENTTRRHSSHAGREDGCDATAQGMSRSRCRSK
jgi:hypothetical protein